MNSKWIISLNDGQRICEETLQRDLREKGIILSPWLYILDYLKSENKEITHIELIVNGKRYNSPSKSKGARFKNDGYPDDFWVCRKLAVIGITGMASQKEYISLSYRLGDYRHFMWIDIQTNDLYIEIKNNEDATVKVINSEYATIRGL